MTGVEVQGRDPAREAYRLCIRVQDATVRAWLPECLIPSLRPGSRPSHQEAYEWIAAHRRALRRAIEELAQGGTPRRPYDILTLIEDAPASCWQTNSGAVGAGPRVLPSTHGAPSKRT